MRVPFIAEYDLNRGRFFCFFTMIQTIIGMKMKQSQEFTSEGKRIPVTYIDTNTCYITQIINLPDQKTIQLGFGKIRNQTKPLIGHLKKAGLEKQKLRFLRTFTVDEIPESIKLGQEIKIEDVFKSGDKIRVTGISNGKGFAGVVKRHHFAGGPRTHGQSDRERAPGSIGQTTTPGRVYRGKRMAGRMGGERVTVQGLAVVSVDTDKKILKIKGLIPGRSNAMVIISKEI
jgi:large subunit ribosomal protein L3